MRIMRLKQHAIYEFASFMCECICVSACVCVSVMSALRMQRRGGGSGRASGGATLK